MASETGECQVLFTERGGEIMDVEHGGEIRLDRTGNTYGFEAWVHVGDIGGGEASGCSLPAAAP